MCVGDPLVITQAAASKSVHASASLAIWHGVEAHFMLNNCKSVRRACAWESALVERTHTHTPLAPKRHDSDNENARQGVRTSLREDICFSLHRWRPSRNVDTHSPRTSHPTTTIPISARRPTTSAELLAVGALEHTRPRQPPNRQFRILAPIALSTIEFAMRSYGLCAP